MHQAMGSNPGFQPTDISVFSPHFRLQSQYHMKVQLCCSHSITELHRLHLQFLLQRQREFSTPTTEETKDLNDWVRQWTLKLNFVSYLLQTSQISCMKFVSTFTLLTEFLTQHQSLSVLHTKWDVKPFPVPLSISKLAQWKCNDVSFFQENGRFVIILNRK